MKIKFIYLPWSVLFYYDQNFKKCDVKNERMNRVTPLFQKRDLKGVFKNVFCTQGKKERKNLMFEKLRFF